MQERYMLTSAHVATYIENLEAERRWMMRRLWPERFGKEKWSPNHGTTRSFTKPGKLRTEGALSALKHIQKILETYEGKL